MQISNYQIRMPLYGASLEGNEQVVSMLLAAGADINLQKRVTFRPCMGHTFMGTRRWSHRCWLWARTRTCSLRLTQHQVLARARRQQRRHYSFLPILRCDRAVQCRRCWLRARARTCGSLCRRLLAAGADKNLRTEEPSV